MLLLITFVTSFAAYYDDADLERAWYGVARDYMEHWVAMATNNSGVLAWLPIGDWGNLIPGLEKKSVIFFMVGMFLDFVWLTTRAEHPHGAHVPGWGTRNRID